MRELSQSIGQFEAYFRQELELIREGAGDPAEGTLAAGRRRAHARTLVVTLLDGLAGLRFSKSTHPELSGKNQERFTRFVAEFCDWPDGQLVSTPVLHARLSEARCEGKLVDHLAVILRRSNTDRGKSLATPEFDQPLPALLALAANEKEEKLIARSQQVILFYRYRNFLVHEFRSPGYGMGSMCTDRTRPCYHGAIGDANWRLAYPMEFFLRLANAGASNFVVFLRNSQVDPYELVVDSSAW